DEVHEDFSGVYREVLIGQEYIMLEELKHFWLKDTRETGYFGVIFSPAYSHTGLSIYGPQGGEVKFCTGWKRVEMRFIMSSTSPVLPIDSGIVTFYDLDRRILGTRQTGILGIGEEESLEYMAPEGSVIGYAILGCGGSGESQVAVNDMRMSR
ncbi:hypothetical protein N5D61_23100, partial [Pseudomonas sp. GD03842]|uniref:hypothetical protein n=1 Tax=Pseudomonas sp. GD03842 TaxID=2975385 RepID=UPI00244D7390